MCSRLTLIPLAGFLLLLPACVPESKEPLGSLATSQQDSRLYGTWTQADPGGSIQYLHIGDEPDVPVDSLLEIPESGLMRFWLVSLDPETGVVSKPFGMRFFKASIGDADYANCIVAPDPELDTGGARRYWFFKYRVVANVLEVWSMNFEATGRLIDSGKLAGITEHDSEGRLTKAQLTASTEELVAYLEAGGDKTLFPDEHGAVYHRASIPAAAGD